ncbi:MAG: GMC oxidoreductase [Gemmatimonadota bacterium]
MGVTLQTPPAEPGKIYDAIVVGSGITGGWAAKDLTEKGLEVLLLERGRPVEHGLDYITEHQAPWQTEYRGRGDRRRFEEDQFLQSQAGPVNEYNAHFFVNDRESPYTFDADKPFLWIRGYHLGGRSIMWGRQSYRWSDLDFEANAREAIGVDWPIRYADLAPWYDYVERFVGLSGQAERMPQLPDGRFLPPMPLNAGEVRVKEGLEASFPDRRMTIGRTAVLTRPHNGRGPCHYCGPCDRGCSVGAYFCSLSTTLPAALSTGRLTIRTHSIVHSLIYDEGRDVVTGVRVIDAETHDDLEFQGRLVFLCASTLGTTQILLMSRSPRFPDGLGNSSGALGHHLMDHHFKLGAAGTIPGLEDRYYYGRRPNGIYLMRFRNVDDRTRHPEFVRGYGYQGGASREGWDRGIEEPGLGAELKRRLRTPGRWRMSLVGFGEMLPRDDNYVTLDPYVTDAWGIPALRIHCTLGENEIAMRRDMKDAAAEMLEAAGCTEVETWEDEYRPGEGIHEMGTARMGRDPRTSVLNARNQLHDVPNVFVTDGACMASAACQNPSLTYMALTARACDYAVEAMKRGEL